MALFDFRISKFIIDIVHWDERVNGHIDWLALAEVVLVPAADDEKGLTDESKAPDSLTLTPPIFFSRFPTDDS